MLQRFALGLLVLAVVAGCGGRTAPAAVSAPTTVLAGSTEAVAGGGNMLQITSSAFLEGQMIPLMGRYKR